MAGEGSQGNRRSCRRPIGRSHRFSLSSNPPSSNPRVCSVEASRPSRYVATVLDPFRPKLIEIGVPRLLQEDDVYEGYFIPKGTIVHAVELAVARDPVAYPDAEAYNPARWLDPSFPTYKEPLTEFPKLMGHHQFGCGLRMCPGVEVTQAELLVACAAILWGFTLTKSKRSDGTEVPVDPEHMSPFLIGGALPFEFDLKVRNEKRAQQIMEMWQESERVEDQVGQNVDVDEEFEL
jgi:hypothetical protein